MIKTIHIENFRSIRHTDLSLGKITVLTGANNSGKSSILYGLMVLQDFVRNPNQSLEQLFALPFINLGGFTEVKSKFLAHKADEGFIRFGIKTNREGDTQNEVHYQLALGNGRTFIDLKSQKGSVFEFSASLDIGLPYSGTIEKLFSAKNTLSKSSIDFKWNGIVAGLKTITLNPNSNFTHLFNILNGPLDTLVSTDFIPIVRGFTKPRYSLVPMTGIVVSEEEIATLLKSDEKILQRVNHYLEKIANRILELPSNGSPALFSLVSKNSQTDYRNYLVNEGSGTNQLVTILAKTFQKDKKIICIDEPEIHLHPSMVKKISQAFVDIVTDPEEKGRQFLVSTHSEHFVRALMTSVAEGQIDAEDVKIYHLTASESGTKIELQKINSKGQIEGGLSHFFEAELSDLASLFKLSN